MYRSTTKFNPVGESDNEADKAATELGGAVVSEPENGSLN